MQTDDSMFFRSAPQLFHLAKNFRDKFRPQLPVTYFDTQTNQPVPPVSPQEANEIEGEGNDCDNHAGETKPILMPIEMDESDVEAINELILAENTDGESVVSDLDNSVDHDGTREQHDPLSTTIQEQSSSNSNGQVTMTEVIDDDIEMTYVEGQILLPTVQSTPMVVKGNDELSGRMPYQAILDRRDVSMKKELSHCAHVQCSMLTFLWSTNDFFYSLERDRASIFGASWERY